MSAPCHCEDEPTNDDGVAAGERLPFLLQSLLRELRSSGRGLPLLPHADAIDIAAADGSSGLDLVAIATWIRYTPASDLAAEPYHAMLVAGAAEVGVMRAHGIVPTLDDLEAALRAAPGRQEDWISGPSAHDALAVLGRLQSRTALSGRVTLDAIFGEPSLFAGLRAAFLAVHGDNVDVATALDEIHQHAMVLIERALPHEFAMRLAVLIARHKDGLKSIAATCGTNVQKIRRLLSGAAPRRDMKALIGKLEMTLGAVPGTVWALVEAPRMRIATDEVYTKELRQFLKTRGMHGEFLPADWETLDRDQKERIIEWIYDHIVLGTPVRRIAQGGHERHGDMSSQMAEEFARLEAFKTATVPREAFQRTKKVSLDAFRVITYGGSWRPTTARTARGYVLRTLGGVADLCSDQSWKDESGLGFLVHPGLQRQVADAIASKRFQAMVKTDAFAKMAVRPPKDKRVYGEADLARLETVMAWFNCHSGFLFHRPPVVVPIPGLIDEAWVALAQRDWRAVAADGVRQLRELADEIGGAVIKLRDPWAPILPILELAEPMTPLLQAVDQMGRDRPCFIGTPLVAALHDRDHVLISLLLQAMLRRANYAKLTWRSDNKGNLRWDRTGYWQLVIPQSDMKNEGSAALPDGGDDLVLVLDPEDDRLYAAIERYLGSVDPLTGHVDETGSSRRLLHGEACGDYLFPGRNREGGIDETTISSIVLRFSARYITGRPWSDVGIMGVIPFGAHAIRDIVATHIIKNTGSLEEAARALFDVVDTLKRHYARFTSVEKSKHTNAIMRMTTHR